MVIKKRAPQGDPDKKQQKTGKRQRDELAIVAEGLSGMQYMIDVPDIQCVPTIYPGFNRALGLGGLPLGTVSIVHGKTHGGKTLFAISAGIISFQRAGHLTFFVDAERAADVRRWFQRCGVDLDASMYESPTYYQDVIKSVTRLLGNFAKARAKGVIPPERAMCIVLDSLTKCVPQEEVDSLIEDGDVDRNAGRWRAAMNKYFFDALTPLIAPHPVTLLILAHEKFVPPKSGAGPKAKPGFKVSGGDHILYDARCQFRVSFIGFEYDSEGVRLAKRHAVDVIKNKVGWPGTRFIFYSGTAESAAAGGPWLDLGRTLVEEAKGLGVIRKPKPKAINLVFGDGDEAMPGTRWCKRLNEDPELYQRVVEACAKVADQVAPAQARDDDAEEDPDEKGTT